MAGVYARDERRKCRQKREDILMENIMTAI